MAFFSGVCESVSMTACFCLMRSAVQKFLKVSDGYVSMYNTDSSHPAS